MGISPPDMILLIYNVILPLYPIAHTLTVTVPLNRAGDFPMAGTTDACSKRNYTLTQAGDSVSAQLHR